MKTTHVTRARTLSALAMAAALVAAPLAASASPGMSGDGGPRHHQKEKGGHGFFGHKGGDSGRFGKDHGMRALNLSQEQQDKIFKIRQDKAQAFYDQKKALRAARDSLRDVGRDGAFDEAKAKQASDALGQAQSRLALLRAQTHAEIQAVLTPEQREKMSQMRMPRPPSDKPADS